VSDAHDNQRTVTDRGGTSIAELLIGAAWNVQGNLAHAPFAAAVRSVFAIDLPAKPNTMRRAQDIAALWFGPRSWLLVSGGSAPASFANLVEQRDRLNAGGGALFDVTASRVAYAVGGPHAERVLARTCPLDFHLRAFPPGTVAQSLVGRVNALFVRSDDGAAFTVMVARSFARDVWTSLLAAAVEGC
jgi:sarcosine oxidase subunit gamma